MPTTRRDLLASSALACLLGPAALASVRRQAQPQPPPPVWKGLPPLVSFSGPSSAITTREWLRISDQATWAGTWARHMGDKVEKNGIGTPLVPQIDFSRCMVVAIFRGDSLNSNGENVVGIGESDGQVLLRYESASFQTAAAIGQEDPGVKVTPFGIFVLPRSPKPLMIEENTQDLIGHPPVWTQRAKFGAL